MIVSVAVNAPAYKLFDYAAPDGGTLLGRRVRVPFGKRSVIGLVMAEGETSAAPPNVKIKTVSEMYEDMPPLPAASLDLIRFCASYYHAPIGAAAMAALPAALRRATTSRIAKKRLQNQNDDSPREGDSPPTLTADQNTVIAEVRMNDGFAPHLLFGNTGAGKTEVYLRLAEKALSEGGRALILTPEIHLTPQLESAFARRFPRRRIAVLHSALTDGERARRWLSALRGDSDIVLGTRLAVFAPIPNLQLIVVDEEHDDSYKQEEGFMFSARDVAVWRARRENIPLVCGSATPSLESFENARRGRYRLLRMNSRAREGHLDGALAKEDGALFHGMSQQFLSELGESLNAGGQALVFVNRRGYSPMLACRRCEWKVLCRACEARMTWHRRRGALLCHRCGASSPPPVRCESCGGEMRAAGIGTQRIEEALNARFAPLQATRLDRDSLSGRGSFAALRSQIISGEARMLVGTQIVAKGHDFPHLSFIGVLNADGGLWSADFRAEERLLMLLRQVIGRGTRRRGVCRVLIQTAHSEHPFYRDLLSDDLESCWRRIAKERRRAKLPPFAYCALLRASALSEDKLRAFFAAAQKAADGVCPPEVRLFDPAPSPVAKLANRRRWQLLAQSESRASLHKFLSAWREKLPPSADPRWNLDIDPSQI